MSQINESALATPGVYVTEIDSFPPSVAQVATAIPIFIGYTQMATDASGKSVFNQAVRISSLVEYKKYFGAGPSNLQATVNLNGDGSVSAVNITPSFQMFNALQLFFIQGGADCYILSVGAYPAGAVGITDFIPTAAGVPSCFDVVQKTAEPTLIVIPDAVMLPAADFNTLMTLSLALCGKMQDRFTIMDVLNGDQDRSFNDTTDVITLFRNGVGNQNLSYGAAYYPWLLTSLPNSFSWGSIKASVLGVPTDLAAIITDNPDAAVYTAQIVKAIADKTTVITPFITKPSGTAKNALGVETFTGGGLSAGVVTLLNNTDIHYGYDMIPVTNDLLELQNKILYIHDILLSFVKLNKAVPKFTDITPAVPTGKSVTTIYNGYAAPGTVGHYTTVSNLARTLVKIGFTFPPPLLASLNNSFEPLYTAAGYHVIDAKVNDPTIYGTPAPGNIAAAAKALRPVLRNLYNSVVSYIDSFNIDVSNLTSSLDTEIQTLSGIYNNIVTSIKNAGVKVPPCGAVAGVYASVDATRGVWKAPANVSLNVIKPVFDITDDEQGDLNIDPTSGKSVNAIRAFTGKGTLVWGARTLAGNDNNWKYIPVRRFFIMVEESVKLAAFNFVFEPNVSVTWLRVRAMIENYLTGLWRLGAITGAKPEQGFYVKVGLGQTMTQDDILNGKLIVEVGIAPVRPAEFIILRFTQTQQQA